MAALLILGPVLMTMNLFPPFMDSAGIFPTALDFVSATVVAISLYIHFDIAPQHSANLF